MKIVLNLLILVEKELCWFFINDSSNVTFRNEYILRKKGVLYIGYVIPFLRSFIPPFLLLLFFCRGGHGVEEVISAENQSCICTISWSENVINLSHEVFIWSSIRCRRLKIYLEVTIVVVYESMICLKNLDTSWLNAKFTTCTSMVFHICIKTMTKLLEFIYYFFNMIIDIYSFQIGSFVDWQSCIKGLQQHQFKLSVSDVFTYEIFFLLSSSLSFFGSNVLCLYFMCFAVVGWNALFNSFVF